MTPREKLFLYHGVLIGSLTDQQGKPPFRMIALINEIGNEFPDPSRHEVDAEIREEVEAAEARFAAKN